jgi:hypothetical protein
VVNRGDENYWGRFTVGMGVSTAGGARNVMLRALDKKAARVSNFQLPADLFSDIDLDQVDHADAWREGELLEVDLRLRSGKVRKLVIRR